MFLADVSVTLSPFFQEFKWIKHSRLALILINSLKIVLNFLQAFIVLRGGLLLKLASIYR